MRDAMLAASGDLNLQMGGPSFRPFTVTVFNTHFYHLFDRGTPEFNRRPVYRVSDFSHGLVVPAPGQLGHFDTHNDMAGLRSLPSAQPENVNGPDLHDPVGP